MKLWKGNVTFFTEIDNQAADNRFGFQFNTFLVHSVRFGMVREFMIAEIQRARGTSSLQKTLHCDENARQCTTCVAWQIIQNLFQGTVLDKWVWSCEWTERSNLLWATSVMPPDNELSLLIAPTTAGILPSAQESRSRYAVYIVAHWWSKEVLDEVLSCGVWMRSAVLAVSVSRRQKNSHFNDNPSTQATWMKLKSQFKGHDGIRRQNYS